MLTKSCRPQDYFGVTFGGDNFPKGPGGLSARPASEFHFQDLWRVFSDISQSATGFNIDDSFVVNTHRVEVPTGGGRKRLTGEDVSKRSILTISNDDSLCLPRSLVCAHVHKQKGQITKGEWVSRWNEIRNSARPKQRAEATALLRAAGIAEVPPNGCGLIEIRKLQEHYAKSNVAVVIYEFSTFGRGEEPFFDGSSVITNAGRSVEMTLNILHYETRNHYQPILNMRAATGTRYYCLKCNKGYRETHNCKNNCFRCKGEHNPSKRRRYCENCNRWFFGDICFQNHLTVGLYNTTASVCGYLRACRRCSRVVRRQIPHKCDTTFCRTCKRVADLNHLCYMAPVTGEARRKKRVKGTLYVYFDLETQQNQLMRGTADVNIHVPNLCVMQQSCSTCIGQPEVQEFCGGCGIREKIFRVNPVKQFVDYVTSNFQTFNQVVCISHHGKAYDMQFILRYIVEEKNMAPPEIILTGSKIIMMSLGNVKFIDSANYFQMPLKDLPKTFGLDVDPEMAKGIFPHFFNVLENENYVGPMPDLQYYSPDTMYPKDRQECIRWYNEAVAAGVVFNFREAIEAYCRMDVNILRRGCETFRQIFLDKGNMCPFAESITIASACSLLYRINFLPENTIGLIPPLGYRDADMQSRIAKEWLFWCEREAGIAIIHAGRGREYRLREGLTVDGYFEAPNGVKHVFQFEGDFYHGCPKCYPIGRDENLSGSDDMIDTLNLRYERTMAVSNRIRAAGYVLHQKWECEFREEKRTCAELQNFLKDHPVLSNPKLEPRDAFYGGRTENTVTRYDVRPGEKLKYIDINSLYPWANKYGSYCIHHPRILLGDELAAVVGPDFDLRNVEGYIRCKILPPRNLFLPVLPYKIHKRLIFPLCRSCVEDLEQDDCPHDSEEERALEGTWKIDEVREAISQRYKILSISEIWQYEVTQYDPATRTGGIFVDYINTFFALKTQASGYPPECTTAESKENYLRLIEERENITIERAFVAYNAGFRSVSKFCLNSFWGKLGMRSNMPKTTVVKTREELLRLLSSPTIEVTNILDVNDDVLYVVWRYIDEAPDTSPIVNVINAADTTCTARLKLYQYLKLLKERVKYMDTDSIIYVSRDDPEEYEPPLGPFLGDFTDELEKYGVGSYIESFISAGPKFYAMRIRSLNGDTHEVCKVKGIRLSYENSQKINFDSISDMLRANDGEGILDDVDEDGGNTADNEAARSIKLRYRSIRRTKFHEVVTTTETKVCKPVCIKRRFINEGYSVPYGFKHDYVIE